MNNLYRKFKILISKKILKLRRMLTANPFKVAEIWRKLGVPIGNYTCIYRDVMISGDGDEPVFYR